MADSSLVLDAQPLPLDDIESVARRHRRVEVGTVGSGLIRSAREVVERKNDGTSPIYGINTGFGSLARVRIPTHQVRDVQRNLIRSHAAGVGDPLDEDVVRAMMLILAASLARGRSGVRVELVEQLCALLNAGVTPVVPSRGSVGASGDLAPLAHCALVLIGEGEAALGGEVMTGAEALRRTGLSAITLEAKEGLALINGTHLMCAAGCLALVDVDRLVHAATAATALAIDACRGTDAFLDARLHDARNQPGQRRVAALLRRQMVGSQILSSHKHGDPRVQDPYSLRAAPQVLGAAVDAIDSVRVVFESELGGVTDNPLVFVEGGSGSILSGGNFHGMPLAIGLDGLAIALCHVAGIAERRIYWLLAASDSENPVNLYLSPQPGLHSGLMIVQYTAAACCNELQTLATPASVGNIPTSAGMEDYNSMGATSAHQAMRAVELTRYVVACELLVMAEALEYQRPLRSGNDVERTHDAVRAVVSRLTEDRPPAPDIAAIDDLIRRGVFEEGTKARRHGGTE